MPVILVLLLALCSTQAAANEEKDWMRLYLEIAAGKRSLDSLSVSDRQQIITMHSILSRGSCGNYSGRCAEACESKKRLEEAANDLAVCAKQASLSEDCSRKFRYTKDAFFEYENAISDVSGECD